ncbi:hypothetical protein EIN_253550 [Entamoeba invadens IP1]|uniref:t-SNARE coiled-coil homology domain-containing protein n=1 Tax=Entamoeba invadens IP1 TaxID=370355 RepID=A0A0A1UER5_ENTIV|nr:hypothetical protein EIN_253550 [Entamoeba invadens IP1]ELP95081.1 hypothetical protein EIN_253550 [Entamoeba invadens IP1]|eukprot:XP_004261852.1 hypothetical protein EIN_253550 [Entamoeba invadens IP1]
MKRYLKAKMEKEDETLSMEDYDVQKMIQSDIDLVDNMNGKAAECLEMGRESSLKLHQQGQQLDKANKTLCDVSNQQEQAKKSLFKIKWFLPHLFSRNRSKTEMKKAKKAAKNSTKQIEKKEKKEQKAFTSEQTKHQKSVDKKEKHRRKVLGKEGRELEDKQQEKLHADTQDRYFDNAMDALEQNVNNMAGMADQLNDQIISVGEKLETHKQLVQADNDKIEHNFSLAQKLCL